MKIRLRALFVAFFVICVSAITVAANAAPAEFRVLLDVDNDATTGCTVAGMQGVEQVFTTRIETTASAASVTRTVRQVCSIGSLGAAINVDTTGWPAGFQAASGNTVVESRLPFALLGSGSSHGNMRIGIQGQQGAAVHTAVVRPDGSPANSPGVRGKRRAVGTPGEARVITLDGNDNDWFGISPLFTGIASGGSAGLRIIRFSAFSDVEKDILYFLFHANLSTDAPVAEDDHYSREEGEGLAVPAPGVLANDSDPNGLPLTATPVSPAARGTVTLNPDGSFTYTPNDPASTLNDAFEYKATNGTKDSSPARVHINVASDANSAPVFTSSNTRNVVENTTNAGAITATDADGDSVTFSITGGADAARFSIAGGSLVFNSAPDFEAPADSGADNQYVVQVTANDGQDGQTVQTITVTVTNANEDPSFTSPTTASVPENTTAVLTVTVDDPDGDAISYSLAAGADAARFSIGPSSGVLTFNPAPDFEAPADTNADNQYVVTVRANDGGTTIQTTITVTVTNVNEGPAFTSSNTATIAENTTAVLTVTTSDPEGNAVTYSISGGADAALFTINSTTGALAFNAAPDFEAPADADANNVY
ncbi:MAG TPA: Ig-like domain-containing protein, partial [Thermoanaerobaculia bacterium]|nr:Ig-like domain-containing protein [Thermoanaerobaculia bacterium]